MRYYKVSHVNQRHILAVSDPVNAYEQLVTWRVNHQQRPVISAKFLTATGRSLPKAYDPDKFDFTICNLPLLAVSGRAASLFGTLFSEQFDLYAPRLPAGVPRWSILLTSGHDPVDYASSSFTTYDSGEVLAYERLVFQAQPSPDPVLFSVAGSRDGTWFCTGSFVDACEHNHLKGFEFKIHQSS